MLSRGAFRLLAHCCVFFKSDALSLSREECLSRSGGFKAIFVIEAPSILLFRTWFGTVPFLVFPIA